jgi:hypothetical protein
VVVVWVVVVVVVGVVIITIVGVIINLKLWLLKLVRLLGTLGMAALVGAVTVTVGGANIVIFGSRR